MNTTTHIVVHYLWTTHFAVLVWIVILTSLYGHLQRTNALPSMSSFQAFTTQIDSRGGNIVVLVFFVSWCLVEVHWGRVPMNFWTGTVFGAFAGALLKTMTGGGSASRGGDNGNGKPHLASVGIKFTPPTPADRGVPETK